MEVDSIEWDPNSAGFIPMDEIGLPLLREVCDDYQDGDVLPWPSWVTKLDVDGRKELRDAAKVALNIYNQKEQKNFNLEKIFKLNFIGGLLCMTFNAKNAETNECCSFRGVVEAVGHKVLLCEIKEPPEVGVENSVEEALSESQEDDSPCKRKRARIA